MGVKSTIMKIPIKKYVTDLENAVAQGHTAALNEMRSDPTYIAALARANSQAEIDAIGKKYKPLERFKLTIKNRDHNLPAGSPYRLLLYPQAEIRSSTGNSKMDKQAMKNLFLSALIALPLNCFAADTVVVHHNAYTTVFANSAHIPVLVTYTLHKSDLDCATRIPRTNDFKADPLIPGTNLTRDYVGSGYDQGHNMSAQDNECNAGNMHECFYYSNMFPQAPNLNRGIWKTLEVEERSLAMQDDSIIVFIGSYGATKTLGLDKVVVPAYCWKVIYIPQTKEWDAYIFPNQVCAGTMARYMDFTPDQMNWVKYCVDNFTDYQYPEK